ncbi:MAG: transcriptional repressor [Gammaproteobacteria bacterium]|nr:transcriptional repressor [Gammaproteobacteria bacterium]
MLKERDITPTQQRVEIAQILFAKPQHLSADQVLAIVNAEGAVASKATIYNTLGLFAKKGLVREVIVDPTKVFYDSNINNHHHFFDMDNGELIDIANDHIELGKLPALPDGTVAEGVDVIIRIRKSD